MKRFFVAACCSLMLCGSLMAQEATIAAPVAPGEDVAVQAVPVAEPVAVIEAAPAQADGSVLSTQMYDAAAYGAVNTGCVGCGAGVAPTGTFVAAPAQGCAGCGQAAPMMGYAAGYQAAPVAGCCGQAAPVQDCCGQAAPVADCCDPCQQTRRVRTVTTRNRRVMTRVRGIGSRRNNCCN